MSVPNMTGRIDWMDFIVLAFSPQWIFLVYRKGESTVIALFLSFLSPTTNDSAGQIGLLCVFVLTWFIRVVRFATRLFQQSRTGQDNLVTDRLAHVVNGQGRDGRTRQGFHFDAYNGYFPNNPAHTLQ